MRLHQQVDTKTTGSRGQREDCREVRWEGHGRPCFIEDNVLWHPHGDKLLPHPLTMSTAVSPSSQRRRWRVVREQCWPKGTHCKAGSRKKNEIERVQRQRKKWRQVKDRQTRKPAPMAPDSPPASHLRVCSSILEACQAPRIPFHVQPCLGQNTLPLQWPRCPLATGRKLLRFSDCSGFLQHSQTVFKILLEGLNWTTVLWERHPRQGGRCFSQ